MVPKTTCPERERATAHARPIPEEAPVTRITCLASLPMIFLINSVFPPGIRIAGRPVPLALVFKASEEAGLGLSSGQTIEEVAPTGQPSDTIRPL